MSNIFAVGLLVMLPAVLGFTAGYFIGYRSARKYCTHALAELDLVDPAKLQAALEELSGGKR